MKHIFALLVLCFSMSITIGQQDSALPLEKSSSPKINWISFEEAYALHQSNPKKWIIDVSTEWCGWCKRMDQTTFSDSLVIDHVNSHFYAVALDGEHKGDITIGDQTYQFVNEGNRGYHQLAAELIGGKRSYPTIVFLSEALQNISVIPGYKNAESFLQLVEFFEVYDAEKNPIKWADFEANYVSPYPKTEASEGN